MHAESFKSLGGILSCPVALDAFRVDSSLQYVIQILNAWYNISLWCSDTFR